MHAPSSIAGLASQAARGGSVNLLLFFMRPLLQVQLLGQTLSIGRPSGYVDPAKAAAAAQSAAEALARFQVSLRPLPHGFSLPRLRRPSGLWCL
jgi:hypothetical protein